jgi:hypothetical protein
MGLRNEIQTVGEPCFANWSNATRREASNDLSVADLWDQQTRQRKSDLLVSNFTRDGVETNKQIATGPDPISAMKDGMIWTATDSGKYTVKTSDIKYSSCGYIYVCGHCPYGIQLYTDYCAVLTHITYHRKFNTFKSYKRQQKLFASLGIRSQDMGNPI